MARALTVMGSPAAVAALAAALWGPATGHPTWRAASRGRSALSFAIRLAVGWVVFLQVRRPGALAAG